MFWTALFPVVALPAALALPGAFHQASKRDYASTDVTLYAYGTNISGVPLVYGSADGKSTTSMPRVLPRQAGC